MPDFKINIITAADQSIAAAKQEADALSQVAKKTEESGKAAEETGHKTEALSLKKGELKKKLNELAREFPLAGLAAKAMLNPVLFAATMAIGAFSTMKAKLDEWNQALDAATARNASKDFLPGIEAKQQAMIEGAAAAAGFATALDNIGEAEDTFATKIQTAIDTLHELMVAVAEVDNAAKANELAKINLSERTGKISGADAIIARAGVDEKYKRIDRDRKAAAENQELALQEQELAHAQQQQSTLKADAEAKLRNKIKADAALKQRENDLAEANKKLVEYQVEVDKKLAAFDKAKPGYDLAKRVTRAIGLDEVPKTNADRTRYEEALENLESATRRRDLQRREIAQLKQKEEELKVNVIPQLSVTSRIADTRVTKNFERIDQLEHEIPKRRESVAIRQDARAVVGNIESQTSRIEVQSQLAGELNTSAKQQEQLQSQIARAIESGNGVSISMLKALDALIKRNEDTERLIKSVETRQRGQLVP